MGKRRTYEERWSQRWFRELKGTSKLFYDYLFDNVDWAGFIEHDMPRFVFETGLSEPHIEGAIKELISPKSAPDKGLIHLEDKNLLWLPDYCELQSNFPLSEGNNAHKGIIRTLQSHMDIKVVAVYIESRGLFGADQPPSNVMLSKPNTVNNNGQAEKDHFEDAYKKDFERARLIFPGTKRGLDKEYDDFTKLKGIKWKEVITLLHPAIEAQITAKEKQSDDERDPWKHFKSWLYNHYWTLEIQVKSGTKKVVSVG